MRRTARIAGAIYVVTFLAGGPALSAHGALLIVANVIATASYVAVTLLFYKIFKPVSPPLSLLAAGFSFLGLTAGTLGMLHLSTVPINNLVFFGVYCLLIGVLILRSTFLPRLLGWLMVVAGLGWLTFASPQLTAALRPYNFAPGLIGEASLTVWLLVVGLNEQRWNEQASARVREPG
jgi:Domain of unknown function (DUF4386)